MGHVIADTYAAALHADAKPAALRLWVHRGELSHHGYDQRGRVLVDIDEAKAVADAKRAAAAAA